ncbi:gamma-glutamylcyclotransferase family protein [Pleomorphomonas sp. PLEO]|uniref:gamma-glutamylcyclotransferase family protein n=1 Tax=Pleomorphomonas sp. PLEO TaxID=3239306 RepID=UPI00351F0D89
MAVNRPVLQFLYGADLNPERLAACCPGAVVKAIGELRDHRLAFFGHNDLWDGGEETVLAEDGASVHGIVVALSTREADFLDKVRGVRLNGTGSHFHSPVTVETPDGSLGVVLYKLDDSRTPAPPSAEYVAYMVAGARHFGLPPICLAALETLPARPATMPVPRIAFPAIAAAAAGGCAC